MKTKLEALHAGIALGIFITAACGIFVQDVMGLERWIDYLQNHWIDLPWFVGVIAIGMAVLSYFRARRKVL
jgi:hypothetical protein